MVLIFILFSCAHTITIDSEPGGAEIRINGELKGSAPQSIKIEDVTKKELVLKKEDSEIHVNGIKKRYWGYVYSLMIRTFFKGLFLRGEDEQEKKVKVEIYADGKKIEKEKEETCHGFFSCFMQEVCFAIMWSVPSIIVGLPSIVSPDIYIFNINTGEEYNKYNLKWLDYKFGMDILKEYDIKELVFLNSEYHKEIKEMNAPFYYKGFGVYNAEDVRLIKLIDIRKRAIGLMFGAYRYTNLKKFDEVLNENIRKDEYAFLAEINYTRVLTKNLTLAGSLGFTGADYHTSEGNYGSGIVRTLLITNYNYSPFSWLGISPGIGAGLFFYDEAGSPEKRLLMPVTSLDINLSPNSWFNFAFTLSSRLNGFGILFKNETPVDGLELLAGFRVMF